MLLLPLCTLNCTHLNLRTPLSVANTYAFFEEKRLWIDEVSKFSRPYLRIGHVESLGLYYI